MLKPFYYILMTQEDLLNSSVTEELLRERSTHYINKNRPIDFWLIDRPLFPFTNKIRTDIKQTNFFTNKDSFNSKDLSDKLDFCLSSCSTIISTNYEYLKWLQLRVGYFEEIPLEQNEYKNNSKFINKNYKSDGIFGFLVGNDKINIYLQKDNEEIKNSFKNIIRMRSFEINKKDKQIKEKLLKI